VSAFADPDIIRMAQEKFVPVAADDWYQRRRQDKEGEFFRAVATSLGKKGEGGATRQGIYCFAADGTPLAYKNAGQNAEVMKQVLRDALAKFEKLPEAKRKAGAVKIEDHGRLDPTYSRTPPAGGLILKTHARILDLKDDAYCKGTCKVTGGDRASRDHVWLTAEEVQSLAPAKSEVGFTYPLPDKIAERITRFHLLDNTRGEPQMWSKQEVRTKKLTLSVVSATADAVELRLEGEAVMATDANLDLADRGYEARLLGQLRYLPEKKTFDRFDLTAVGSHWGESRFTRGARSGKTLLGVSFELAGDKPGDKVPPQGIRERDDYFGKR
jgi:hypothetical protein